ncbi:hypothetical protein SteCoe_40812 [Stentor coeruleus]|uniref:Uncharacterized protein n=1 Tax=Stentor coeruleus TaxID=5963 RepID=A0A1R2AKB8_9CILI|nr:hypothetical protein SteCoe_40812 [Stentor coeruleus]
MQVVEVAIASEGHRHNVELPDITQLPELQEQERQLSILEKHPKFELVQALEHGVPVDARLFGFSSVEIQ